MAKNINYLPDKEKRKARRKYKQTIDAPKRLRKINTEKEEPVGNYEEDNYWD